MADKQWHAQLLAHVKELLNRLETGAHNSLSELRPRLLARGLREVGITAPPPLAKSAHGGSPFQTWRLRVEKAFCVALPPNREILSLIWVRNQLFGERKQLRADNLRRRRGFVWANYFKNE